MKPKPLKVALICHFSNKEVLNLLPRSKRPLVFFLKRLFKLGKPTNPTDIAPWISILIQEFKNFKDVELHIIAPYSGLKVLKKSFTLEGIHYHFFKSDLPLIHFDINTYLSKKPKYYRTRYFTKRFLKRINPDIINVIGAENPPFAISALDIKNTPTLVCLQTIYGNPDRKKYSGEYDPWRAEVEKLIHQKHTYFGCQGRMHRDLLLQNNAEAIVFKYFFNIKTPNTFKNTKKQFDFVFFAGVSKRKGVEELIEAMQIVVKQYHYATLSIAGGSSTNYMKFLSDKVQSLNLENNITFSGFFDKQEDLYAHASTAKYAVLPVKLDIIPSSIIEAIYLGLPVVTYKTTGTPYLNKDGEAVLIGEVDDIKQLAANMIKLLHTPDLGKQLSNNALALVNKEYNNTVSAKRLKDILFAIHEKETLNKAIPADLLFKPSEFPIYE